MQPSSRSPDISAKPPEQWLYGSTASSSMTAWPVVAVTRPGNTFTLEQFFSPGETMSQFLDVIGDGPLLQLFCLLLGGDGTVKLSAGSRALHRHATCDDVWKQLVEAQWPGGRVLCKQNFLVHKFLDAFPSSFNRIRINILYLCVYPSD